MSEGANLRVWLINASKTLSVDGCPFSEGKIDLNSKIVTGIIQETVAFYRFPE